ncbi:hypothetical protein LSTR_LSTR014953, partial [Laodelphax striatellus]
MKFRWQKSRDRHEMIHTGFKPYACKVCDRKYSDKRSLDKHEPTCTEKPVEKEVEDGMQVEIKEEVPDETLDDSIFEHISVDFDSTGVSEKEDDELLIEKSDDDCLRKSPGKRNLESGKPVDCSSPTRNVSKQKKQASPETSGEQTFKCTQCKQKLTKYDVINGHDCSFRCKTCDKTYMSKSKLKRHERVHLDVKPYKCKLCLKEFSRADLLELHERTHSGLKPYQCKLCNKCFSMKGGLVAHLRSIHRKFENANEFCIVNKIPKQDRTVAERKTADCSTNKRNVESDEET